MIRMMVMITEDIHSKFDMIHRPTSHVLLRLKFFKIQIIKFQN